MFVYQIWIKSNPVLIKDSFSPLLSMHLFVSSSPEPQFSSGGTVLKPRKHSFRYLFFFQNFYGFESYPALFLAASFLIECISCLGLLVSYWNGSFLLLRALYTYKLFSLKSLIAKLCANYIYLRQGSFKHHVTKTVWKRRKSALKHWGKTPTFI